MARGSIGWPVGLWLTVCAGLAAVVAYQLSSSFPLAPTVTAAPPGAPALDLAARPAPPRAPAEASLDLIAARPLFSEDRRPYVPPPEPVEAAPSLPSERALPLELAGTYLTGTDQAALLLVAGEAPTWLRKGDRIEGWQVETIAQDRVELRKDDRQQVLLLRNDRSAPAARRTPRQAAREEPVAPPPTSETDGDEATPQ